jgi:hypothetical protein
LEFRRLNPGSGTFKCVSGEGAFKIKRPTGPKITREGLALNHPDHDYNVRLDGNQLWLLDDDRTVGFAVGDSSEWHLLLDDREYALEQPKIGNNNAALMSNGQRIGEIEGKGFPLRIVTLDIRGGLRDEQTAFVAMVTLLGWRESDRSLFSSIQTPSEGAGP